MTFPRFPKAPTVFLAFLFLIGCRGVTDLPVQDSQLSVGPKVSMVVPQTNGVGTNRKIEVVFSEPMDPSSVNASSFVVDGVNGAVTYDAANNIGAFKASPDFAVNTTYAAHITTAARSMAGTPLTE